MTPASIDSSKLELHDVAHTILLVVFLVGVCIAIVFGLPRFRRHTIPPTKRGWHTIAAALRSPRQIVLLVVGNIAAAMMSALCLDAAIRAYGGHVSYWQLLVANIIVGTVASLIPVPGGNTLVSAVGLTGALLMFGVSETVAVAGVVTQQLIATYLMALPGWFATNHMLRHGYL